MRRGFFALPKNKKIKKSPPKKEKKILINSLLPETSKRVCKETGSILLPSGRKGGAAPIFRDFLGIFSPFYFVICLSSPSILVVYDTDNKLSLLARSLSLSPDLSCFQLAKPPSPMQRDLSPRSSSHFPPSPGKGKGARAAGRSRAGEFVSF